MKTITSPVTVAVMQLSKYDFLTQELKSIKIISGVLSVLLPQCSDWQDFQDGETFRITAGKSF
ncbi:pyrimidine/purine nucleoside phosphorylase [Snodgrassella sp. ESL0253]|uniref:pyrimidine/purine nucleoside phosphorylase n=1 Tax=Snodgrassella sp. ESL0253 TaxID=2705031 RepID=UPI0015819B81|nr:pyrimidine/purine nucleoside phosphorylase [Snodgrassella sp. ESL0253]NUE67551.1 pyrimidine/purine nucleoside phosphorylase [Snodgrassella sp. ESL0253]